MPAKPVRFKLTQIQMESSKKIRALLGLTQADLSGIANKVTGRVELPLSRATVQRAEGNGGGWVKPRTRLDLIKVYELTIKASDLSAEDKAACFLLLEVLRGDGVFVHQQRYSFIAEVAPPSLIALHPVKSRLDLESWWRSIADGPSIFDTVKVEAKASLDKFDREDYEWLDREEWMKQGFSKDAGIYIDEDDFTQISMIVESLRAWVSTWDAPDHGVDEQKVLADKIVQLSKRGISISIGLALASATDPNSLPAGYHGCTVRKWKMVIAFGMQLIETYQVWWQDRVGLTSDG